jgi:hypothetical protein
VVVTCHARDSASHTSTRGDEAVTARRELLGLDGSLLVVWGSPKLSGPRKHLRLPGPQCTRWHHRSRARRDPPRPMRVHNTHSRATGPSQRVWWICRGTTQRRCHRHSCEVALRVCRAASVRGAACCRQQAVVLLTSTTQLSRRQQWRGSRVRSDRACHPGCSACTPGNPTCVRRSQLHRWLCLSVTRAPPRSCATVAAARAVACVPTVTPCHLFR